MRFMRPFYRQQAIRYLLDDDNDTTSAQIIPYPIGWVVIGILAVIALLVIS